MIDQHILEMLAEEYDCAPPGIHADLQELCEEFAAWNRCRATELARFYRIENTDNEVPYPDGPTLLREVSTTGKFLVPLTYWEVPAYDQHTNIALRIVHDLDGHVSAGFGFTLQEEVLVYHHQCQQTPSKFWPLVFSEVLHQLAYTTVNRSFPTVQKPFLTERQDLVHGLALNPWESDATEIVRCPSKGCYAFAADCEKHR